MVVRFRVWKHFRVWKQKTRRFPILLRAGILIPNVPIKILFMHASCCFSRTGAVAVFSEKPAAANPASPNSQRFRRRPVPAVTGTSENPVAVKSGAAEFSEKPAAGEFLTADGSSENPTAVKFLTADGSSENPAAVIFCDRHRVL